jgi:hypothetical protein
MARPSCRSLWRSVSLALALFLVCGNADADGVAAVDGCTLSAPSEYAGRLVKVTGTATSGFEKSVFTPSGCELPEYFALWLEVPDPGETVPDRPPAGTHVIYDVTPEQREAWSNAGEFLELTRFRRQSRYAAAPAACCRS